MNNTHTNMKKQDWGTNRGLPEKCHFFLRFLFEHTSEMVLSPYDTENEYSTTIRAKWRVSQCNVYRNRDKIHKNVGHSIQMERVNKNTAQTQIRNHNQMEVTVVEDKRTNESWTERVFFGGGGKGGVGGQAELQTYDQANVYGVSTVLFALDAIGRFVVWFET